MYEMLYLAAGAGGLAGIILGVVLHHLSTRSGSNRKFKELQNKYENLKISKSEADGSVAKLRHRFQMEAQGYEDRIRELDTENSSITLSKAAAGGELSEKEAQWDNERHRLNKSVETMNAELSRAKSRADLVDKMRDRTEAVESENINLSVALAAAEGNNPTNPEPADQGQVGELRLQIQQLKIQHKKRLEYEKKSAESQCELLEAEISQLLERLSARQSA